MTQPNSVDDKTKPDPSTQVPQGGNPGTGTPDPNNPGASGGQPQPGQVPLTALHEERDKRQALQAETQALKEQLQYLQSVVGQQPPNAGNAHGTVYPQQQQQPMAGSQQLDQLWEQDPRRAVQAELTMALDWYDRVNSQLDMQEASVAAKHPDFDKFRGEVRRYVRSLPTAERAKPGVVELAYYACRGQKVDDIIQARQQELLDKIRRGEQVQGFDYAGASAPPPVNQSKKLTEEQKQVAAAMNLSEEEYLKHVK